MKKLNFLQILGFTVEIFSFVALLINIINNNGSRGPLYLLFLVGVILVAVGNIVRRNQK